MGFPRDSSSIRGLASVDERLACIGERAGEQRVFTAIFQFQFFSQGFGSHRKIPYGQICFGEGKHFFCRRINSDDFKAPSREIGTVFGSGVKMGMGMELAKAEAGCDKFEASGFLEGWRRLEQKFFRLAHGGGALSFLRARKGQSIQNTTRIVNRNGAN